MECLFNSQGVNIGKMAARSGKCMPVRTSLLESESETEEVTGTEPHESIGTGLPIDNDADCNDK